MTRFEKMEGYPEEIQGRFNSFITTQFDDSLSVEMQIRSLIKWISSSRELINDIVDYINLFIEMFDERLQEEIVVHLNEWLDDGTLAQIINNDVFDMKSQVIVSKNEPQNIGQNTYWFQDVGESAIDVIGTSANTNVKVSDNEPEDDKYDIWFNF